MEEFDACDGALVQALVVASVAASLEKVGQGGRVGRNRVGRNRGACAVAKVAA